jgi:type III pantothenate kinase
MNLVLDFGNTRIKAGIFNKNELLSAHIFNNAQDLTTFLKTDLSINNCLIASVTSQNEDVLNYLSFNIPVILFSSTTPLPLKNLYKSASTLGSDRLAASIGSFYFFPNQAVLTIDAGTCIKYNFVTEQNEYVGGSISPGISMRLKAMHDYTHALPLIEPDTTYDLLIGDNTKNSLLSGALIGTAAEVDNMIERYLTKYPNMQVVITGGDSDYLCKQLKNRFFANQNILLYGLNSILNFNLEQ